MQQKKVIIIGASSGIGKEMALLLAQQNNQVAITGRRKELLQEIKTLYPDHIVTAAFDVMGTDNIPQLQSLIQQLQGMDVFIYNAGYGHPTDDLNWETEHITTATNVDGFVEMINYAFAYFVQQGYGQIAVTSSIAALRGNSKTPAYSASKAYMSRYAEGLNVKALQLKKDIVITDIRPGYIATKLARSEKLFWALSPQTAARRIVKAIEQKKRITYLSKRWWLIAQLIRILPYFIYKRLA